MPERPEIPQFPEGAEDREILRTLHTMLANNNQTMYDVQRDVAAVKTESLVTTEIVKKHNRLAKKVQTMGTHLGLLWTGGGVVVVVLIERIVNSFS